MRIRLLFLIALVSMLAACAAPTAVPTSAPAAVPTKVPTEIPTALPTATSTEEPTAIPTPEKIVVTDALGRTVEFDQLPERVVVAGKATTLIMGVAYSFPRAPQVIVAVEERNQSGKTVMPLLDAAWAEKAVLETDASAEQIAPLNPDLVILKTSMAETLGNPLEQLEIKVVYVDMETPESFYRDLAMFGVLFGDTARAEEVIEFYQAAVEYTLAGTTNLAGEERPSVLLLQYSDKGGTVSFNVPPAAWLQTWMVQAAGGTPVWAAEATGNGWTVVSFEQIAAWNPQYIFIVDYKLRGPQIIEDLKADAQWSLLPAVTEDKLYAFAGDVLSWDQPDPRWVLGLTWLGHILHPDLFPNYTLQTETAGFYSKMYGMADATLESEIFPLLESYAP